MLREEEGGGSPQVKQLFEDEIIVWPHLFTPMAQRGAAKQHNWLCYLMAASTSLCKDIFQRVWLKDILSSSWLCHQTICKANIQSDRLLISSHKKFILDVSAEGNTMYICAENSSVACCSFALKWS